MSDIKVTIPTEIEDIRLGQFQEYVKLTESLGEDAPINEFVKMKLVSIFCDVPMDLVREGFKSTVVDDISKRVLTLARKLTEPTEGEFKPTFKLGDTTFGFINDFEEMKAGEFADLSTYITDINEVHKAMAVMYRPIEKTKHNKLLKKDQYILTKYNGTAKYATLMKQMPAIKFVEASFFLTNSFIQLRECFLTSMANHPMMTDQTSIALKQFLAQNGAGTKHFTALGTTLH